MIINLWILSTLLSLLMYNNSVPFTSAQKMLLHHQNSPRLAQFRQQLNVDETRKGFVNVSNEVFVVAMELGGEPTVEALLVFDTGSSLLWVESASCVDCMGSKTPEKPLYNGSSTLNYKPCQTESDCGTHTSKYPNVTCINNQCSYLMEYGDGSYSIGLIGTDQVSPFTDHMIRKNITFGIGIINECMPDPLSCFQGFAGFGAGPFSLPSQLSAKRFGFCLPHNESLDGAFLFDDLAKIPVHYQTAPLYNLGSIYATNLTEILMYTSEGQLHSYPGDSSIIVVDTGTSISRLQSNIFDNLIGNVRYLLNIEYLATPIISPVDPHFYELCYNQSYSLEITIQMSDIYITFSDPEIVWLNVDDQVFCLSFARIDEPINILGSKHFTDYMVVYDLVDPNALRLEFSYQPLSGDDAKVCLTGNI